MFELIKVFIETYPQQAVVYATIAGAAVGAVVAGGVSGAFILWTYFMTKQTSERQITQTIFDQYVEEVRRIDSDQKVNCLKTLDRCRAAYKLYVRDHPQMLELSQRSQADLKRRVKRFMLLKGRAFTTAEDRKVWDTNVMEYWFE